MSCDPLCASSSGLSPSSTTCCVLRSYSQLLPSFYTSYSSSFSDFCGNSTLPTDRSRIDVFFSYS